MFKTGIKKLTLKELCILAMLCALTIVLGFYATWRFGSALKISAKFVPVYIAGALFGPICGGIVGSISDIASYIANPLGGFLPLITLAEFLYGFLYGVFFYRITYKKTEILKTIACVGIQAIVLDALVKTWAISTMVGSAFMPMLITRAGGYVINFIIQFITISVLNYYMERFKTVIR